MSHAISVSRLGAFIVLATLTAGGSACAMTSPPADGTRCTVAAAERLAEEAGGADAVCGEILRAFAAAARAPARIEVTILSASRARARIIAADGRSLPVLHVGSSDQSLTRGSFERLGRGLAEQWSTAVP